MNKSSYILYYLTILIINTFLLINCVSGEDIIELKEIASDLINPVSLANAGDGSNRLFVMEQRGLIKIIDLDKNELQETPFLDIESMVFFDSNEAGLADIAFHPDFIDNQRFFVNYNTNIDNDFRVIIAEYRVSDDNSAISDLEEKIIMEISMDTSIHHSGQMHFGTDGFLYVSVGDGGPGDDRFKHGQNIETIRGTIIRIDVDDEELPFSIPLDNPFVDKDGADEIWAYGFRNPWRFSFDRLTDRLFVGDVGQASFEEVDIVVSGGNYGWSIMEGTHCFPPEVEECDQSDLILPIIDYDHSEGRSVTGGYVYRGTEIPELFGLYIFGDFGSSRIWSLEEILTDTWERKELLDSDLGISSFGEDEAGELYVADHSGGKIYKIIARQVTETPTPTPTLSPTPSPTPTSTPGPISKLFQLDCEKPFIEGRFTGAERLVLNIGENDTCVLTVNELVPGTSVNIATRIVSGLIKAIDVDPKEGMVDSEGKIIFTIKALAKGLDWIAWAVPNENGEFEFSKEAYDTGLAWGMFVKVNQ